MTKSQLHTDRLNIPAIERIIPTIEATGGNSINNLKTTVQAIEARIVRTRKAMRTLRIILSNQIRTDWKKVEEYQDLNDQLRALEIFKAEFKYQRRML